MTSKARLIQRVLAATVIAGVMSTPVTHAFDVGAWVEENLSSLSQVLFSFGEPLGAPATDADVVPREEATAQQRQLLAGGLEAAFVARNVASLGDMIAFWPDDLTYTHLIICIEQGRSGTTPAGNDGLNAAVQRVALATGAVETILHGMSRCDGIRTTQWGTVLATEEVSDGRAYEIIHPLTTTGHWIADRATGDIRDGIDSDNPSPTVVQRQALPTLRWEGLSSLDTGVVYLGDEVRPGDNGLDVDGGAIFKFVPTAFYNCGSTIPVRPGQLCPNTIRELSKSPLVSEHVYAYSASCQPRDDEGGLPPDTAFPQYGQSCEIGEGAWVQVDALQATMEANARGATGYYRPEDLHIDPTFGIFAQAQGVRFCWTNTGNGGAAIYAETLCMVDDDPQADGTLTHRGLTYLADRDIADDGSPFAIGVAQRFVEGDPRFNSHDNLDIHPITGHVYVVEDDTFGEIYACLPDGADRDLKSDGCVAMLSITDPDAEPTGFIFDGTGKKAFYIVQHGQQPDALLDFTSNPVDGQTDDLIQITGFTLPNGQ
jgi:secreted PhoX family phosphatase